MSKDPEENFDFSKYEQNSISISGTDLNVDGNEGLSDINDKLHAARDKMIRDRDFALSNGWLSKAANIDSQILGLMKAGLIINDIEFMP